MRESKWFPYRSEENERHCKLFCFNHAGGSSLVFREWLKLDESIEVIPVEIPGRRKRISEKCETDFRSLINVVSEEVAEVIGDDKVFIYGHSMGAALAFSLTEILEKKYGRRVEGLFVAGRQAPADEDLSPYRTSMGTDALRSELMRIGDTPEELLEDKAFMAYYMPIVYSDYRLSEDYSYDGGKVSCPVYALCGEKDVTADAGTMKNWRNTTEAPFELKEFRGSHFFAYNESSEEVKKYITERIRDVMQHNTEL